MAYSVTRQQEHVRFRCSQEGEHARTFDRKTWHQTIHLEIQSRHDPVPENEEASFACW